MRDKHNWIAFAIPFFLLFVIVLFLGLFTDKVLYVADMQAQYVSLFSYLQDVLHNDASFLYTTSKGLGGSMIGTYAYYLASPFHLLLFFFSKTQLNIALCLIVLLKMSAAGLSMYLLLKQIMGKHHPILWAFSTAYALMAYNIGYYMNMMWLDGVFLAPLVLLGLKKLMNGQSVFYVVSLSLAIFSNYYIGFMLCIVSFFVFLIFLLFQKEDRVKRSIRFFGYSFLAVGICSFLLFPTLQELFTTNKMKGNIWEDAFSFLMTPIDFLSRTYFGTFHAKEVLNEHNPYLYCGLIFVPLFFFYFFNSSISKRERIVALLFLFLFLISMFFMLPNRIWHGFQIPNGFVYRYSFLFSLYVVLLGVRSYQKIDGVAPIHYLFVFLIYCLLSFLMTFFSYVYLPIFYIWISVFFVFLYLVLLFYRKKKDVIFLLIGLILAELFANGYMSLSTLSFRPKEEQVDYQTIICPKLKQYDELSYRVEVTFPYTYNDSLLCQYKGISSFLSTMDKDLNQFFIQAGYSSQENSVLYNDGNTLLMDSLLGVKFMLSKKEFPFYQTLETFPYSYYVGAFYNYEKRDVYLQENPYALPLGYMVKGIDFISSEDPFSFQTSLFHEMLNTEETYFKSYPLVYEDGVYKGTLATEDWLYVMVTFETEEKQFMLDLLLEDQLVARFSDGKRALVLVPNPKKPFVFQLDQTNFHGEIQDIVVYGFQKENVLKGLSVLKEQSLQVSSLDSTRIQGHIEVVEDGYFLTTIPYDRFWKVFVNGEEIATKKAFGTFLSIPLEAGSYEIVIKYENPILFYGVLVSLFSVVLLVVSVKKRW